MRRPMRRSPAFSSLCDARGTALVAALGIAALLLPLGAFVVLRARTHMLIQHNLRRDLEAFSAAEAGLEEAVARIRPGTSFDDVLFGPDGIGGTADDGTVSLASTDAAIGATSPFRPQVRVVPDTGKRVRVISSAPTSGGSAKTVEALLERSPWPFTPAAVHLESDPSTMILGSEGLQFSGFDHDLADIPGAPTGLAAPIAGLSTAVPGAAPMLANQLAASGAQVSAAGVSAADPLDLSVLLNAVAALPLSIAYASVTANTGFALGTDVAPQVSLVGGDCEVLGQLSGSGILIVSGLLHVVGTLTFHGVLVAMGGVVFEAGSRVEVRGAFWRAAAADTRLELRGSGAFLYSSSALAQAEASAPGVLPHAALVVGWREQL
jgi:hypothetical protein